MNDHAQAEMDGTFMAYVVIILMLGVAVYAGLFAFSAGSDERSTETTPTVVCDAFTVNDSVELMCFARGNVTVEFGFNQSNVHGTLWTHRVQ